MKKIRLCLQEILDERHITQKELSELTRIYPATLNKMCRNEGIGINKAHLAKVAQALDINDISKLIIIENS